MAKELRSFSEWRSTKGGCLLCSYVQRERQGSRERVVCENASFTAVVPFWAVWPFEMMIVAHRHLSALNWLTSNEERDLADIIRHVTIKYDNLFQCYFPYSMGIHQAPTTLYSHSSSHTADGSASEEPHDDGLFHLHLHFYPPLLRSASVRKFLVGYEMCGEPQRDMTPEQSAARLRELPSVLYRDRHAIGEP